MDASTFLDDSCSEVSRSCESISSGSLIEQEEVYRAVDISQSHFYSDNYLDNSSSSSSDQLSFHEFNKYHSNEDVSSSFQNLNLNEFAKPTLGLETLVKLSPTPIFYENHSAFVVEAPTQIAYTMISKFLNESEVDLTPSKKAGVFKFKGIAYENFEPIQFVLWCYEPTLEILAKHGVPESKLSCTFLLEFQRMSGCCMASMDFKRKLYSFLKSQFPVYSLNKAFETPVLESLNCPFPEDCELLVSDLNSFLSSPYHEHIIDGLSLISRISAQSSLNIPPCDAHSLLSLLVPLLSNASAVVSNLAASSLSLLVRSSGLELDAFLDAVRAARQSTKSSCAVRHIDRVLQYIKV